MIRTLSWSDIELKIKRQLENHGYPARCRKVYGVPRGGIPVALIVSHLTGLTMAESIDPENVDTDILVVDDVIDSGRTRALWYNYPFLAVWDKSKDGNDWIEFPWERMNAEKPAEDSVVRMLEYIGEDVKREGLLETPKRVIKAWDFLFSGYKQKVEDHLKVFDSEGYDAIVLLKDIEMYSMCEHHLLPFFGKVHVAYIPDKKVIGVSKLARIVDVFSKRAQIQERLGNQVTAALMEHLKPKGAACIIEAQHLCMQMRGVQKQNSVMVTSSLKGVFLDEEKARLELMELIKK